jgi:hypothetical protein
VASVQLILKQDFTSFHGYYDLMLFDPANPIDDPYYSNPEMTSDPQGGLPDCPHPMRKSRVIKIHMGGDPKR